MWSHSRIWRSFHPESRNVSSIWVPWELLFHTCRLSGPSSERLNQNLHFNKILQWSEGTVSVGSHGADHNGSSKKQSGWDNLENWLDKWDLNEIAGNKSFLGDKSFHAGWSLITELLSQFCHTIQLAKCFQYSLAFTFSYLGLGKHKMFFKHFYSSIAQKYYEIQIVKNVQNQMKVVLCSGWAFGSSTRQLKNFTAVERH